MSVLPFPSAQARLSSCRNDVSSGSARFCDRRRNGRVLAGRSWQRLRQSPPTAIHERLPAIAPNQQSGVLLRLQIPTGMPGGALIGPGGANIRYLLRDTSCRIKVDEDRHVAVIRGGDSGEERQAVQSRLEVQFQAFERYGQMANLPPQKTMCVLGKEFGLPPRMQLRSTTDNGSPSDEMERGRQQTGNDLWVLDTCDGLEAPLDLPSLSIGRTSSSSDSGDGGVAASSSFHRYSELDTELDALSDRLVGFLGTPGSAGEVEVECLLGKQLYFHNPRAAPLDQELASPWSLVDKSLDLDLLRELMLFRRRQGSAFASAPLRSRFSADLELCLSEAAFRSCQQPSSSGGNGSSGVRQHPKTASLCLIDPEHNLRHKIQFTAAEPARTMDGYPFEAPKLVGMQVSARLVNLVQVHPGPLDWRMRVRQAQSLRVAWDTKQKEWVVEDDDDPMGARQRALAATMDVLSRWSECAAPGAASGAADALFDDPEGFLAALAEELPGSLAVDVLRVTDARSVRVEVAVPGDEDYHEANAAHADDGADEADDAPPVYIDVIKQDVSIFRPRAAAASSSPWGGAARTQEQQQQQRVAQISCRSPELEVGLRSRDTDAVLRGLKGLAQLSTLVCEFAQLGEEEEEHSMTTQAVSAAAEAAT